MKCNIEKINQFFLNQSYNIELKDLVLNLMKEYCSNENIDADIAKISLMGLDFYEVETDDVFDEQESKIIDFYKLSTFAPELQKFTIEMINILIKNDYSIRTGDFLDEFLIKDLKILVPYEKWKKTDRKNKLNKLKEI